ncbi:hypothetical protein PIB30_009503 [Stylosanthes scabra]|uniref:Uncharacterized protein n=1 Tax=Stylosanthes scabra TaxID=79078 RepID=A0ABU6Y6Z4_9FABA|nr:hypothetical protein [Stylosanthes scabra]
MAHYQNQYGAVTSSASKDPIQKEMDLSGDTTGTGDVAAAQVIVDEYHDDSKSSSGVDGGGAFHHDAVDVNEVGQHNEKKKKGIIEKVKDKLPGTHHHSK